VRAGKETVVRSPLVADPWTVAQIDAAVAPYAGVLSASQLAWMREQLAETLATDAAAAKLLRRAHPRVVEESGEVPTEESASTAPAQVSAGGEGGRPAVRIATSRGRGKAR
jgi:hypothetical protein